MKSDTGATDHEHFSTMGIVSIFNADYFISNVPASDFITED